MDRETAGLVRYGYTSSQPDDRRPKKKIKSSTLVNDYLYRCTIIWVQAVQGSNCVCHTTSNAPVGSPPYLDRAGCTSGYLRVLDTASRCVSIFRMPVPSVPALN